MKWLLILAGVAAVLGLLLAVLAFVGSRLPADHVASRRAVIRRPPAEVFTAIRDFARAPEWRKDVKRVEILNGAPLRFREEGGHGTITMELVEDVAPARMVTRIADESLPFGGTWTFELTPAEGGAATSITITERGTVRPAIFRALSRYVFGHHRTLETYLRALGTRYGEWVRVEGP
jgi:uncharacterized protein YndB with AHSA1/START domain